MDSNQKRKKRAEPRLGLINALGVPPEACDSLPVIRLIGGKYAVIEHHRGVLKLSDACVRLYSCLGIIRIEGKDIVVASMDNECMCLSGDIKTVVFE